MPSAEMLTRDLRKGADAVAVNGKLIVYLSTQTNTPIQNPGPSSAQSAAMLQPANNGSALSINTAGGASGSRPGSTLRPTNATPEPESPAVTQASQQSPVVTAPSAAVPQPISANADV